MADEVINHSGKVTGVVKGKLATNDTFWAEGVFNDPAYYVTSMSSVHWTTGKNVQKAGHPGFRVVAASNVGEFKVDPPMPFPPTIGDTFVLG